MRKRFQSETWNGSRRWGEASPFNTAWLSRESTSGIATEKRHCGERHRFAKCCALGCRLGRARTPRGSRAIIRFVFIYQKEGRDSALGGARIGEELVSGTGAV